MLAQSPTLYSTDIKVIFRDIDALGHVNNAVFFTYMETARTSFFMDELNLSGPNELPLIIAQATCNYRSAARFGDVLNVDIHVSRIGKKSFDLNYLISTKDGRQIADGLTVMVTYDYEAMTSIPIPQNLKELLLKFYKPEENT